MPKFKKHIYAVSLLGLTVAPIAATVACGSKSSSKTEDRSAYSHKLFESTVTKETPSDVAGADPVLSGSVYYSDFYRNNDSKTVIPYGKDFNDQMNGYDDEKGQHVWGNIEKTVMSTSVSPNRYTFTLTPKTLSDALANTKITTTKEAFKAKLAGKYDSLYAELKDKYGLSEDIITRAKTLVDNYVEYFDEATILGYDNGNARVLDSSYKPDKSLVVYDGGPHSWNESALTRAMSQATGFRVNIVQFRDVQYGFLPSKVASLMKYKSDAVTDASKKAFGYYGEFINNDAQNLKSLSYLSGDTTAQAEDDDFKLDNNGRQLDFKGSTKYAADLALAHKGAQIYDILTATSIAFGVLNATKTELLEDALKARGQESYLFGFSQGHNTISNSVIFNKDVVKKAAKIRVENNTIGIGFDVQNESHNVASAADIYGAADAPAGVDLSKYVPENLKNFDGQIPPLSEFFATRKDSPNFLYVLALRAFRIKYGWTKLFQDQFASDADYLKAVREKMTFRNVYNDQNIGDLAPSEMRFFIDNKLNWEINPVDGHKLNGSVSDYLDFTDTKATEAPRYVSSDENAFIDPTDLGIA